MTMVPPAVRMDADGTLHLGPRTIPLPRSISDEARLSLAVPRAPGAALPALDDIEEWRQLVETTNALFEPSVELALARSAGRSTVVTTAIDAVTVHAATPSEVSAELGGRAWITVHGGGFLFLGGAWARAEAALTAAEWGCPTYGVDYRMPPDQPFPAALDDVITVYRHLLLTHAARDIIVCGASAGSNIACAAFLKARDSGLPLPGALILDTPAADLTLAGDTYQTLRHIDSRASQMPPEPGLLYAAGHDLSDPYVSPVFADYRPGFSPTYIQSGTRDILLSSSVQLHRAMRRGGVAAELHVWEGAPHSAFFLTGAPEEQEVHAERVRFLSANLAMSPDT